MAGHTVRPKAKSLYTVEDATEDDSPMKNQHGTLDGRRKGCKVRVELKEDRRSKKKRILAERLVAKCHEKRGQSQLKRKDRWMTRRRSLVMQQRQLSRKKTSTHVSSQGDGGDFDDKFQIPVINLWRCLCKCFVALLRNWKSHRRRFRFFLNNFDALDLIVKESDSNKPRLLFDRSEFDSQKQGGLSNKAKAILRKNPQNRTEQELKYTRNALRNYKTIAEYPVSMQVQIAKRAEMIEVDERQLLTRQGQEASNFHLVLSGSAIVFTFDPIKNCHRIVCFINRGETFSETAIVSGQARETSVVSRETIQLLIIHKQDFLDIFLSGGLNNPNDPFLKTIPCLTGWPLEKLCQNPGKAMQCYFKQGYVLAMDTTKSEWLYVVKSGSCTLMKKLQQRSKKKKTQLFSKDLPPLSHQQVLDQHLAALVHSHKTLPKTVIAASKELLHEMNLPTSPLPFNQLQDREIVLVREKTTGLHTSKPFLTKLPKGSTYSPQNQGSDRSTEPECSQVGPPIFTSVQTLTRGCVFGLADIFCGPQPSFCLVSNGTEVILIHRKFFLEWLPSSTHQRLQDEVYPFASDKEMLSSVEGQMKWETYRKKVTDRVLGNLRRRHRQLNSVTKQTWHSIG